MSMLPAASAEDLVQPPAASMQQLCTYPPTRRLYYIIVMYYCQVLHRNSTLFIPIPVCALPAISQPFVDEWWIAMSSFVGFIGGTGTTVITIYIIYFDFSRSAVDYNMYNIAIIAYYHYCSLPSSLAIFFSETRSKKSLRFYDIFVRIKCKHLDLDLY